MAAEGPRWHSACSTVTNGVKEETIRNTAPSVVYAGATMKNLCTRLADSWLIHESRWRGGGGGGGGARTVAFLCRMSHMRIVRS